MSLIRLVKDYVDTKVELALQEFRRENVNNCNYSLYPFQQAVEEAEKALIEKDMQLNGLNKKIESTIKHIEEDKNEK